VSAAKTRPVLAHHRRAGGEAVRQPDQAGERRRPDHDLLGEARQMHGANRAGRKRLQHEVAVGDGVERIRHRPREVKSFCRHGAIDRKRRAGERTRAERAFVEPDPRIGEAAAVARRHFHVGEQMMAERHRLRRLQMGETRHDGRRVLKRLLGQRPLIGGELPVELVDGVTHPEPEIGRDLIVARTRRMQPPGRRPDQFAKPALDVHMDVFQRALEGERAGLDL
jgi:hypothetical protein